MFSDNSPHESNNDDFGAPGEKLVAAVRLALVSGVGPRSWTALVARFGSPQAVLAAPPSHLRDVPGIGPKLSKKIGAATEEIDAEAEIADCRATCIEIVTRDHLACPRGAR